jgi:hypothetical protein
MRRVYIEMSYEHVLTAMVKTETAAPITSELKKFAFKVNSRKTPQTYLKTSLKYDETDITADISAQFKKCGWATMDLCMKWKCVQDYMVRQGLSMSEDQAKLIAALKKNTLKVTYDKSIGQITYINMPDN